jgi:rRNA maturation RNase YbeY
MTTINFYNEDVNYILLHKQRVRAWLLSVIKKERKKAGEISYIFCSDNYLVKINEHYLNETYLTDVITFDYSEKATVLGDIFISIDSVKDNAKLYKQLFFQELLRVMVHGILHLCGYKDKTDSEAATMREKEDYYLQKFI